jgi:hypothetical protein
VQSWHFGELVLQCKMQLLSPTGAVRAFIAADGANDKAYGQIVTWRWAQ